ncbi:MAG: NAD(P)/FAD-dependent oxidoreductase [Rhodospirillaceae bacterium]|nr:NAD(P)/FAD-dependent oxidoreductase [Rhodospirillaceae bacterium]MDE0618951.1 NAD(P)/FAD-dependent oxidoreductase [Rhodospirillaceae bacterium]
MTGRVDILVVGLGPAGASAAREAARAGASVLAVDRKRAAGEPVQCAEFVPRLIGLDVEGVAPVAVQPIEAMHTFVEAADFDSADGFTGTMIDRGRFDALLVEQARDAGAECRFDTVWHREFGVRELEVTAKLVIGADGPRSKVRAAAGLLQPRLIETRQITVPLLDPNNATDIFLSAEIEGGYAWLFPKGDVANLGLGVAPKARPRLKPVLEGLRRRLMAEGRIGDAILGNTGGAIPVDGIVGPVAALPDGAPVLLAGDAAGLTNPVTGAGIPAAVMSGALAGEAAARWVAGAADALDDYAEEIDDLFGASLRRAVARRRELERAFADSVPQPADLRRGWIAYPEYWAARPAVPTPDPQNAMGAP